MSSLGAWGLLQSLAGTGGGHWSQQAATSYFDPVAYQQCYLTNNDIGAGNSLVPCDIVDNKKSLAIEPDEFVWLRNRIKEILWN